ncbi:MAG: hypothetical protein VZS44_07180 [Bacilli bacterium]|nr:hypothetical protein [Bacilli bacterium]
MPKSKELLLMLNNKGQSLVIFVVMIPIALLVFILIYDIGNLSFEKQELDNINKLVIDYGLDNINNIEIVNEMYDLAKNNNNKINYEIKFIDQEIYINSKYYVKGVFTKIINIDGYLAKSSYKGYLDKNNKHIIKSIK